uniref:Magnesium-protoporphyrin IX methyltransferase C-terminal domain-containing protein n=2 Tax=Brassica campestris TaxID=3711 RepID=M4DRP7_BRACM
MIAHLASLAEKRVILSFAPKTFYYDILKRIGELFSGPSKATRAYLHAEADVERALRKVGCRISKSPREDSLPPSSTFPGSSKLFPCRSFLFIC